MTTPRSDMKEIEDRLRIAILTAMGGLIEGLQRVIKQLSGQNQEGLKKQLQTVVTQLEEIIKPTYESNKKLLDVQKELNKLPIVNGVVPPGVKVENLQKESAALNKAITDHLLFKQQLTHKEKMAVKPETPTARTPIPGKS